LTRSLPPSTWAWRDTAAGLASNPDLRIEHCGGRDEIVLTPLDADDEPESLIALRAQVEALLPEVETADLLLEVHGCTGFLNEYTHMAGTPSREPGLPETFSALLVSEACNVGLTPVADQSYPPLTRERLNWVAHNHLRSATHAAANTRLVGPPHRVAARPSLGRREMATADGMRFIIPVSTRAGQTVGGSVEPGNQCRRPRSRAAMLIRVRVLNEELTSTGFTDQPRSWLASPGRCALRRIPCSSVHFRVVAVARPARIVS